MKEKNGEHPFGESGQLILLFLFLLIWVMDSFLLKISTFLSDDISLYIRLIIFVLILGDGGLSYSVGPCRCQPWAASIRSGIDRSLPVCETSSVFREHHVLPRISGIHGLAFLSRAGGFNIYFL